MERKELYKVVRTDFGSLENLLNILDVEYPDFHLYQVLPEHSYDGALAVVILKRNEKGGVK